MRDPRARNKSQSPQPEPVTGNEPLVQKTGEGGNTARCAVIITSFRVRLTDRDNLCGKYFVDALRYAGAIPDDTEDAIDYYISQKKVATRKEEKTIITLEYEQR